MKKLKTPRALYAVFDSVGELADICEKKQEAKDNAYGPRFREGFTLIKYVREKV